MYLRVKEAWETKYLEPISFAAGEPLTLGRWDEEYPGWVWTTTADGNAGWAPEQRIEILADGVGRGKAAYTARELDTAVGDTVAVVHTLNDWAWVRDSRGHEGWVPAATLVETGYDSSSLIEGEYTIPDFQFKSGEALAELRLHYRTLGQPRRDESGRICNAIWIGHGTTGSGAAFLREQYADVLFAPGGLLDVADYYIILPDGIGHGQSSRPSDGLRAHFPHYGYEDMVRAQYQLLTEHLGVDHLRLVMGTSMGGMHSWVWGYLYPDFMDALLPLASLPTEIAGRNRMLRRMALDAIRLDPSWREGEYEAQPAGLRGAINILIFMTSVPLYWRELAPTQAAADEFLAQLTERHLAMHDANDFLYQFNASWDYNPEPHLEKISAPLVAINSADDQVNPPELGILERLIKRVPNGKAIVLPISPATRGHGSHSWPLLWQEHLAALLAATA
jgi:homoserine O-acetyltransferase